MEPAPSGQYSFVPGEEMQHDVSPHRAHAFDTVFRANIEARFRSVTQLQPTADVGQTYPRCWKVAF
jgi:hypothetical protein